MRKKRTRKYMLENELVTGVAVTKRKLEPQKLREVKQMNCPLRNEMLSMYSILSLKNKSVSVRKLGSILENFSKNRMEESFEPP
jgi:hypothetical protein